MNNRREFLRVPLNFFVNVQPHEGEEITLTSRDLSLRGVFLSGSTNHKVGDICKLAIQLGEEGGSLVVEFSGKIVRSDEEGIGVEFLSVFGAAGLDHLRNLILYNSDDPATAEENIMKHRGIERKDEE